MPKQRENMRKPNAVEGSVKDGRTPSHRCLSKIERCFRKFAWKAPVFVIRSPDLISHEKF